MSCTFNGNSDLYGIGIRVGVYLSLASTIYAKYHLPSALSGALVTNAIFVFALLVAILQNVVNGELHAVESYIMLQVVFGFVLSSAESGSVSLTYAAAAASSVSKEDYDLAMSQFSRTHIAEHALGLLRIACATINTWFWFYGIDHLGNTFGCLSFEMFFFAQFRSDGDIRKLFQAMALLYLLQQLIRQVFLVHATYATYVTSDSYILIKREKSDDIDRIAHSFPKPRIPNFSNHVWSVATFITTRTTDQNEDFLKLKRTWALAVSAENLLSQEHLDIKIVMRYFRRVLLIRDSIMLVWTILTVELGLKWNHISGVNTVSSTGQLIPLVIGIASLIPSLSESYQKILRKKDSAIARRNIRLKYDQGQWRYALRNGKIVTFQHRLNVQRRWSTEYSGDERSKIMNSTSLISSHDQQSNLTVATRRIFQTRSANRFSIIGGFTPTKFRFELRGPPLYPNERGWRLYVPLKDGTLQTFNSVFMPPNFRRSSCPNASKPDTREEYTNIQKRAINWQLNNTPPRILSSDGVAPDGIIQWSDNDYTKTIKEALADIEPQILTTELSSSLDFSYLNWTFWMVKVRFWDWRNSALRMGLGDNVPIPSQLRHEILFYLTSEYYDEDLETDFTENTKQADRPIKLSRSLSMGDIGSHQTKNVFATGADLRHVPSAPSNISNGCADKSQDSIKPRGRGLVCWGKWRMLFFHLISLVISAINVLCFIILLPLFGPWLVTWMNRNIKWMLRPSKRPQYPYQDSCLVNVMPAIRAAFWYLPRYMAHYALEPLPEDDLPNGMLADLLYKLARALPSHLPLLAFAYPLWFYISRKPVYEDELYEVKRGKEEMLPGDLHIKAKVRIWIQRIYYSKSCRKLRFVLWPLVIPLLTIGKCWVNAFRDFQMDLNEAKMGRYARLCAWLGYIVAWITMPVTLPLFIAWYLGFHFIYVRKWLVHGFAKAQTSSV